MLRRLVRAARYLPGDVSLAGARFWRARHFGGDGRLTIRPAALGGEPIELRIGTSDPQVAWYVLCEQDQLPPHGVEPRSILDLGANIGIAAALFATRFTTARIVAVEPDPANAALARTNLAPWADRCEVIEGAAWIDKGTLALTGDQADSRAVTAGDGGVAAIPIDELVARAEVDGALDFVKMNIEGAERALLRDPSWTRRVRAIRVEVHPPYTVADCGADLQRAGFTILPTRCGPWVTALRT